MKVNFEGTLEEFKAVFGGVLGDLPEFQPSSFAVPPNPVSSLDPIGPGSANPPDRPEHRDGLPQLSSEVRRKASEAFTDLVLTWVEGFEDESVEQPDRLSSLQAVGTGPTALAVIVMAHEIGSLQRLIERALLNHNPAVAARFGSSEEWLDYLDRISGNMVQVAHLAFPDLATVHDYSTKWRKQ